MRLLLLPLAGLLLGCATTPVPRGPEPERHFARQIYDVLIERREEAERTTNQARRLVEAQPFSLGQCAKVAGEISVYGIGSSTMGSLLGPLIHQMMKADPVRFRRWGKESSGLARPDFHDWPREVPHLVRKYSPDAFVVSLGTNDFQPIRLRNRKWVKQLSARWKRIYAQRVDQMLDLLSGPNRETPVIWVGPTAFENDNALRVGPVINRIIKDRVQAFAGPAFFVDAWAATTTKKGKPAATVRVPGRRTSLKVFGHDNIHLTADAVKQLMARPVVDRLRDCVLRGAP